MTRKAHAHTNKWWHLSLKLEPYTGRAIAYIDFSLAMFDAQIVILYAFKRNSTEFNYDCYVHIWWCFNATPNVNIHTHTHIRIPYIPHTPHRIRIKQSRSINSVALPSWLFLCFFFVSLLQGPNTLLRYI